VTYHDTPGHSKSSDADLEFQGLDGADRPVIPVYATDMLLPDLTTARVMPEPRRRPDRTDPDSFTRNGVSVRLSAAENRISTVSSDTIRDTIRH